MEPVTTNKNNHLQLIITLGLVGILFAVVGGYIYYGMQMAGQEQVLVEPPAEVEETQNQVPGELTAEEREAILADLAKENPAAPTPLSVDERIEILDSLQAASTTPNTIPLSDEEKIAILESLQTSIQAPIGTVAPTE